MKKTYMHPEMEIVEIKSQVLLAGSVSLTDTDFDPNGEILDPEFEEIPGLNMGPSIPGLNIPGGL